MKYIGRVSREVNEVIRADVVQNSLIRFVGHMHATPTQVDTMEAGLHPLFQPSIQTCEK